MNWEVPSNLKTNFIYGTRESHTIERLWPTIFCKDIVKSIDLKPHIII